MSNEEYVRLAEQFGTPLWVYRAEIIRDRIRQLRQFDTIRFAQKACSNLSILRLMREESVVVDAVSHGEIERALEAGFSTGSTDEIIFTADLFEPDVLSAVVKNNITVNVGSLNMLEQIGSASKGHRVWLRVNPGFGEGHSKKTNTGGPLSKHGIWIDDLPLAVDMAKHHGVKLVGLHMHIGSGVNYDHLSRVCQAMVDVVTSLNTDIEAISAGGGLSVPYKEGEPHVDCSHYFGLWNDARTRIAEHLGHAVRLEIEPGRFLTAEAGALLAQVNGINARPEMSFILLNAGFNDLVRPAMYGSYHKITVLNGAENREECVSGHFAVAGPLCESGDVFTQDSSGSVKGISLTTPKIGDFVVFHDAGAYGASMSSNYNTRPLAAEVLIDGDRTVLIRRRQTVKDLLQLEQLN
ncbi:diaminopimelate decarboxylase [Paraburkholderia sp. BR14263]|uniref:diaminopimelate decarboxylase n=1 Tax=unclassified Paraburkholderia TaxID=2615204 RepID=UPI0034CF928F